MNKNILILIIVVILIAILGLIYFFVPKPQQKLNPEINSTAVQANPAGKMPETNPFASKVNPMEGYTNPFSK